MSTEEDNFKFSNFFSYERNLDFYIKNPDLWKQKKSEYLINQMTENISNIVYILTDKKRSIKSEEDNQNFIIYESIYERIIEKTKILTNQN
jgi:hypothetical protein